MLSNKLITYLPGHLACDISTSDIMPVFQVFCILVLMISHLLGFSQMMLKIRSFQVLQTCLHLWRLSKLSRTIFIMTSLKMRSGNMRQSDCLCLFLFLLKHCLILSILNSDLYEGIHLLYKWITTCLPFSLLYEAHKAMSDDSWRELIKQGIRKYSS